MSTNDWRLAIWGRGYAFACAAFFRDEDRRFGIERDSHGRQVYETSETLWFRFIGGPFQGIQMADGRSDLVLSKREPLAIESPYTASTNSFETFSRHRYVDLPICGESMTRWFANKQQPRWRRRIAERRAATAAGLTMTELRAYMAQGYVVRVEPPLPDSRNSPKITLIYHDMKELRNERENGG